MRILLVDDDPQILGAIKTVLESDGHEVVTAKVGRPGLIHSNLRLVVLSLSNS